MARAQGSVMGSLFRVTAGSLSAGAALVSILSYTRNVARGAEPPPDAAVRAHRLSLAPLADTAASLGDSIQLAALVTDDRGAALLGIAPAWSSGDPAVAEVDQAGTVVGRGPGSTAIIVRVGRLEARARIVVAPRPAVLRFADSIVRVPEGERLPVAVGVSDARGHPVAGAVIGWTSSDPAVLAVDSAGEASGVSPGQTTLTARLGDLQATVPVEVVPVPASITILAGEDQRAPAGRALDEPVTVQIVSRTGRPIPGIAAAFQVRGHAGAADPVVDTSDARGTVSTVWTLGPVPGRQQLAVSVEGVVVAPVLTAEADPVPANVRIALAGEAIAAAAGDSLPQPVVIRVTDSAGAALTDVPVSWRTPDRGAVVPLDARTDSTGEIRGAWRLGPKAGRQRLRVQVGNPRTLPPFTVTATALPGDPAVLVVAGGDGQVGRVGARLARPVLVRAVDRHGNPVPGAEISATPGEGELAEGVVRTDSAGVAKFHWTLGHSAGGQRLAVRVAGLRDTVVIAARARPSAPAKLTYSSAPAAAPAGRALPRPLALQVTDAYGNPVAGQTVVLTPSSGSVSPARAVTDSAGRARVRWTLGSRAGKASLTGQVKGSKTRATLTLTVKPRP